MYKTNPTAECSPASSLPDLVESVLLDFARRSPNSVDGYITHDDKDGCPLVSFQPLSSPASPSYAHIPLSISKMATPTNPITEERMPILLSNQYYLRMHRNRAAWYKDCQPLDTAPKCVEPAVRHAVSLIKDWRAYAQSVALDVMWRARRFHELHYEINGVVWDWSDPSANIIADLVTSTETIEFIISNDPFRTPHIFVSHSQGEEPHCLDASGNPDTLGTVPNTTPTQTIPKRYGFTPRQSLLGPSGKAQLFLPPRAFSSHDRDLAILERTTRSRNRQRLMYRKSDEFQAGLRRIRAQKAAVDRDDPGEDLEPMKQKELVSQGLSERTECPLSRLGIFQQDDITAMAESAEISSDSESEDEEDSEESDDGATRPRLSGDTSAVLRRLGMLDSDSDSGSGSGEEGDNNDSDTDEEASEQGDTTFGLSTVISVSRAQSGFPASIGHFPARVVSEPDEESSDSSLFADGNSDSESPDTEDDC